MVRTSFCASYDQWAIIVFDESLCHCMCHYIHFIAWRTHIHNVSSSIAWWTHIIIIIHESGIAWCNPISQAWPHTFDAIQHIFLDYCSPFQILHVGGPCLATTLTCAFTESTCYCVIQRHYFGPCSQCCFAAIACMVHLAVFGVDDDSHFFFNNLASAASTMLQLELVLSSLNSLLSVGGVGGGDGVSVV